MPRKRFVAIKVQNKALLESIKLRGELERKFFKEILKDLKKPVKPSYLESKYGMWIYRFLEKLYNSGFIEKTEEGYRLSLRLSKILRKFADEWEGFVRGEKL